MSGRPQSGSLAGISFVIPTGTLVGRYEIIGRIGAGRMGEVYKARDAALQRFLAVKSFRPPL